MFQSWRYEQLTQTRVLFADYCSISYTKWCNYTGVTWLRSLCHALPAECFPRTFVLPSHESSLEQKSSITSPWQHLHPSNLDTKNDGSENFISIQNLSILGIYVKFQGSDFGILLPGCQSLPGTMNLHLALLGRGTSQTASSFIQGTSSRVLNLFLLPSSSIF